jgi:hypothetical protein
LNKDEAAKFLCFEFKHNGSVLFRLNFVQPRGGIEIIDVYKSKSKLAQMLHEVFGKLFSSNYQT